MVYITGDIHGSAEPLYDLFDRFQPTEDDIIVLLGDVGVNYTGRMRDRLLKQELCDMKSTFFCIHGNHENRPQNICSQIGCGLLQNRCLLYLCTRTL